MRKFAWSAAIGFVAASVALASTLAPPSLAAAQSPGFVAATAMPCPSAQVPDPVCSAPMDDDAALVPALGEMPASADAGWTALPASHGTGLDFEHAAAQADAPPSMTPDGDTSNRLIPALLALGGLLVLLRSRPA